MSRGTTNREPELRRYLLPGGWEALVGRSDADNDTLSLRVAAPDDYWLHVRGMPGSHVILRPAPGAGHSAGCEPDRETIKAAAGIAAYHSKARGGGVVPVSCTRARHVTKPRGVPRGTVQIRREVVLKVRPGLPEPGRA